MASDLSLSELRERYEEFKTVRGWEQFHTPQNIAQALSVEASELLECFLWHDNVSAKRINQDPELRDQIREELADVVIYALSMASELEIDLLDAVDEKLEANEDRFDPETSAEITTDLQEWQRGSRD
jgi:NTP pyrophosphatase (non-canonical NTP hydrolase)